MKKRIALLSMIGILALSACNKKQDTTKRSDNPSTKNVEALQLDLVKNGSLLKEVDSSVADYVTVKVAEEYKNTLFYLTTDLTETFEQHKNLTKSISFSALTFTSNITDAEKSSLTSYFYDEKGIEALDLGFDVSKDLGWETKVDVATYINDYTENKNNYSISVIYMPALVTHYQTSFTSLECYVMFPLYYQIYKTGDKSETFDAKSDDLTELVEFDGNLLKTEVTEVSA